jgi:hypothetical protein
MGSADADAVVPQRLLLQDPPAAPAPRLGPADNGLPASAPALGPANPTLAAE